MNGSKAAHVTLNLNPATKPNVIKTLLNKTRVIVLLYNSCSLTGSLFSENSFCLFMFVYIKSENVISFLRRVCTIQCVDVLPFFRPFPTIKLDYFIY